MFIYRFNQLIRSRILWGFFAIIISFAFVAVGSCFSTPPGAVAGKINGKKIQRDQLQESILAIRGVDRNNRDNEMSDRVAERLAWEQIAAIEGAKKLGLTAKAEDIRDEIQRQNAFQGPEGFDMNRYRLILREQGLSPEQFERLVSRHILLSKLSALVDSATWVSPMELEDELAAMTDKFTVQTAAISNGFVGVEMRMSDEDYKAFYEEQKETFGLPDRVAVRYITIPLSNYLARVTVQEDSLQDYYDSNFDKFKSSDTNHVEGVKPFAEVRDEIFAIVQLEEAADCAETNMMFWVFGKLEKAATDTVLATVAANEGVEVKTSPLFSQNERLYWTGNAKDFTKKAFDLEMDIVGAQFDIVRGNRELFVIELVQKSAAHVPPFEEVAENVKRRAQEKSRRDAFESYAKEIRNDISKLMTDGKTFEEAATAKALNVSTSLTYTVTEMQSKPIPGGPAIAYGAMSLKKGELSEAVSTSPTQSTLIYLQNRQPGDALAAEMMSSQVRMNFSRRRDNALFTDWLKWNLDQQLFEPSHSLISDDIEDDAPATEEQDI